jgi:hypothetical protein
MKPNIFVIAVCVFTFTSCANGELVSSTQLISEPLTVEEQEELERIKEETLVGLWEYGQKEGVVNFSPFIAIDEKERDINFVLYEGDRAKFEEILANGLELSPKVEIIYIADQETIDIQIAELNGSEVKFVTHGPPNTQAAGGEFMLSIGKNGCLYLDEYIAIWPAGYSLEQRAQDIVVVSPAGEIVGFVDQPIFAGGGELDLRNADTQEANPELPVNGCVGSLYWRVGGLKSVSTP